MRTSEYTIFIFSYSYIKRPTTSIILLFYSFALRFCKWRNEEGEKAFSLLPRCAIMCCYLHLHSNENNDITIWHNIRYTAVKAKYTKVNNNTAFATAKNCVILSMPTLPISFWIILLILVISINHYSILTELFYNSITQFIIIPLRVHQQNETHQHHLHHHSCNLSDFLHHHILQIEYPLHHYSKECQTGLDIHLYI